MVSSLINTGFPLVDVPKIAFAQAENALAHKRKNNLGNSFQAKRARLNKITGKLSFKTWHCGCFGFVCYKYPYFFSKVLHCVHAHVLCLFCIVRELSKSLKSELFIGLVLSDHSHKVLFKCVLGESGVICMTVALVILPC